MLKACLESVFKSKKDGFSFEVLVVDNASGDDSAAMVRKNFPKVKLIVSKKNIGFAAGNNLALRQAQGKLQIQGKYVLFLNPDTVVFPLTLKKMIEFMDKNQEVGVSTCRGEL